MLAQGFLAKNRRPVQPPTSEPAAAEAPPTADAVAVIGARALVPHGPEGVHDAVDAAATIVSLNSGSAIALHGGAGPHAVDDDDVALVFSEWPDNTSVATIDVSLNHVSDRGAAAIADALRRSHQDSALRELDLSANIIGDDGAIRIVGALPPTVTRLDLSANRITDQTIRALVDARPAGVVSLHLRDNPRLTDASLVSLASWLGGDAGGSCPLRNLHVSGNKFTDAALPALAKALGTNRALVDLQLANCQFHDPAVLVAAVAASPTLQQCLLAYDGRRVDAPAMDAALRRNRRAAQRLAAERSGGGCVRDDGAAVAVLQAQAQDEAERHAAEVARMQARVDALEAELRQRDARAQAA